MADKYIEVANFKFGLDKRKSELTSNIGSLAVGENGHINQGGEFEKRKAFGLFGTLPSFCKGLQEISTGLIAFGSKAQTMTTVARSKNAGTATIDLGAFHGWLVGDVVTLSGLGGTGYNGTVALTGVSGTLIQFALVGTEVSTPDTGGTVVYTITMPAGVTYQRLEHYYSWLQKQPVVTGTNGAALTWSGISSATDSVLSSVDFSCSFNDKTLVIATFSAFVGVSSRFLFYDGSPVVEQSVGIEFSTGAGDAVSLNQQLVLALAHYFPEGEFTADRNVTSPYNTILTGPIGTPFTAEVTSDSGFLTSSLGAPSTNATDAVAAVATFYFTAGSSGSISVLNVPKLVDGAVSGNWDLIGAVVNYSTSMLITAQNLANLINSRTSLNDGFTAQVQLAALTGTKVVKVIISGPATYGAVINAQVVNITTTGTIKTDTTSVTGAGAVGALTYAFAGGVTESVGTSQTQILAFTGGAYVTGSHWTLVITMNDIAYTLGSGNIGGIAATFCYAQGKKAYLIAGKTFYFSLIDDPTRWEQQDASAGSVDVSDLHAAPTDLVALASYQGKLAVFARRTSQIWAINADPANYAQGQVFMNIGTMARLSVQSLGDLDVLFLSDTGVRSLRVRDASQNAFVADIGSPIDSLIQTALLSAGDNSGACSIVEPTTNSYWLYLKGTIYVFSYYPSSKISAWSTYLPTYEVIDGNGLIGTTSGLTVTYTTVVDTVYKWTASGNAVNLVCGIDTLTTTGYFKATSTLATITYNPSVSVGDSLCAVTQTTFIPVKFLSYNGQVYILANDGKIFQHGGTDNNTFDSCVPTGVLPYFDDRKPATNKFGQAINAAVAGQWDLYMSIDPKSGIFDKVARVGSPTGPDTGLDSTFDTGKITYEAQGTHFAFKFVGTPTPTMKKISSLMYHYNTGEAP